jgi:hypothetical protein
MATGNAAKRFLDAGEEPTRTLTPLEGYEKKDLVSLEEAVKPIDVFIHNLNAMVWTAKRNSRNPSDGLTSDESASIFLYTLEWPEGYDDLYTLLNQKLRSEERKCPVLPHLLLLAEKFCFLRIFLLFFCRFCFLHFFLLLHFLSFLFFDQNCKCSSKSFCQE